MFRWVELVSDDDGMGTGIHTKLNRQAELVSASNMFVLPIVLDPEINSG
ncbi:hypothetical protein BH23BAC2_BH23BAC2_16360 [soil metagenome]